MKLIGELEEWVIGAAERYGDPARTVGTMFARYAATEPEVYEDILALWHDSRLNLCFGQSGSFPMEVDVDGPRISEERGLEAFGIREISPGLWTIEPSLNIPGQIHVFVHIYDVPVRPPWKSLIILPTAAERTQFQKVFI